MRRFLLYDARMQKITTMKVERIAHDGAAESMYDGVPLRVHGLLPQEEGVVEMGKKHGLYVGVLKELLVASHRRKTPEELHFLSCSPWQVMEYSLQAELKHELVASLFEYYEDAPKASFLSARQFFGYRTKVEFSFTDRKAGEPAPLALAFHVRGQGGERVALPEGCALVSSNMNDVALHICARLRDRGYTARDLKTLVIRESKSTGKILAILFAKKEEIEEFAVSDIPNLAGFIVFHSTEKSPASVPTRELWRFGEDTLTESILDSTLSYSWDSFFQNNIPMFEESLRVMREYMPPRANVLELYSGVGTIGLLLAPLAHTVRGIEVVPAAVDSANENARRLGISNYSAQCIPAEKIDAALLRDADVLVLDPPRAGLHPKVIKMIMEALPKRIIYLSCNPDTQARDHALLAERYRIDACKGFDFYPQTPHLESLLILSLRDA